MVLGVISEEQAMSPTLAVPADKREITRIDYCRLDRMVLPAL